MATKPFDAGGRFGPFQRATSVLLTLALCAWTAWLASALWRSRGWPVINDASLFHYVALRVSQGAVPYRDVFDFQLPGTLLYHLAIVTTAGTGDAAWRAFDLTLLAACAAVAAALARPSGPIAGWTAAAAFVTWHLSLGAWNTGQRDLVVALLLAAAGLAVARECDAAAAAGPGAAAARAAPRFLAGLAVGAAATIKPHAAVFAIALAPFVVAHGGRTRALVAFVGGCALAPLAAFGWLAASGGLPAFVDIVAGYLAGPHLDYDRAEVPQILRSWTTNRFVLPLVAAGALAAAFARPRGGALARRVVLAAVGFGYGLFHIALQQKGWSYHFYPAALFLCVAAASALGVGRGPEGASLARCAARATAAALVAFAVVAVSPRVEAQLDDAWRTGPNQSRVAELEADLRSLVPAGAKVQVLDLGPVGIEALMHLGIAQPTRSTYAVPLYLRVGCAYTQDLRREFLEDLERDPPAAFVVFDCETGGGCALLDLFPELRDWVERGWRVELERATYRVYVPARG